MNAITAGSNQASEPQRAIASSMTELAAICGDLESEIRRLTGRIASAIPGGSPFDRPEKSMQAGSLPAPVPMRSHLNDELQSRIDQLRTLAGTLSGISERIEL